MPEEDRQIKQIFCLISDERVYALKSPVLFNRVMPRLGISAAYVPFSIEEKLLGEAIRSLKVLNISGANVAAPYKEAAIPYMDALSESANIIGAINTVVIKNSRSKGYNTNAIGIMDALEDKEFNPAGKKALILGAGGAARAVAFVLKWLRAENICIAGRNTARTQSVAARVGGTPVSFEELGSHPFSANIIVNATTVSTPAESEKMAELPARIDTSGCELIFDLNYGKHPNIWQQLAERQGVSFMDGIPTLINQVRNSLSLWTGMEVSPAEFKKALAD